ncbi:hypothetical protein Tco_1120268 [Tanacetum coccineum]
MSDKKDEINKKNEQDWSKVEWTPDLVDYVYDKYENIPVTDEMLDDLYNFAMMKEKFLSMVESKKVESKKDTEKIYRKLTVTDDMIKYGKDDKGKGKVKGDLVRANQAEQAKHVGDDVDLVDADDVDLLASLDLENIVTKLKEDFTRLIKAKKAKEADEAEVIKVSSDEGFSCDEVVVCFNDVKYPLINSKIRMFKEKPTTSREPTKQLASTSTRFRAPKRQLASSSRRSRAPIA